MSLCVTDLNKAQPVGVPGTTATDAVMAEREGSCVPKLEVTDADGGGVLKRKRGRPAKGAPKGIPAVRQKNEDEDVCFICFDGGSLVLCDRRGCPKAYHPACVKRDESFFHSKAKWNCGWHLCSYCQKASHYMCYTCTYSVCKRCTKDVDFVCIRGNKGLCGICMKTIMLIENSAQGNKSTCEVDFDDRSSWEYLFKVYWMCLKEKLSLTLDELLRANPLKGAAPMRCRVETSHELHHLKDDKCSGSVNSCIDIESNNSKTKRCNRRDKHRQFSDGVVNDVRCSRQDLPTNHEPIGNTCITKNPKDTSVGDSNNVGAVRSEVSGAALDISSLLLSSGMEQPFNDFVNEKLWHYQDPTGKVQGPFSMLQLYKWKSSGHFPPDFRIWRKDENSVLLSDALSGKCSKIVSLPLNSQLMSEGDRAALDNKDDAQDGVRNETRDEIHADSKVGQQSKEQKVDDTCTQSNGKDESVRSNTLHSPSSCLTIATDGNINEGQSGNMERREESSKCEISCLNQPRVSPPLPSTAVSENLNENPSEKLSEGHGIEGSPEDNGNLGSHRTSEGQSNSGLSYQKQSDSEVNSGQSSGHNWDCPQVIHPPCNNASTWLAAIFGEPTEFSSLVDESVSDLLAEVEAMESLGGGGLESPTSIMKCNEEFTDGSKNDSLNFALGMTDNSKHDSLNFALGLTDSSKHDSLNFALGLSDGSKHDSLNFSLGLSPSPILGSGKGDALSSTGDLHLPSQFSAAQPFQQADMHYHQTLSREHSSRSSEVESTFSRLCWNPINQYFWDPKC